MAKRLPARRHFMRKGKRIRYVDGFAIRNSFPDFDVIESDATSGAVLNGRRGPHIPKGEIWIDRRFEDEDDLLLEVHRMELGLDSLPYAQVRRRVIEALCDKDAPVPPFYRRRTVRKGGMTVRFVKGDIVRRHIDPGFIFGGHDLVYDYVPKGEVWIDDRQDPREVPFTLVHELTERRLMNDGWNYADAHREATNVEFGRRRAWLLKDEPPLRLRPFRQSEAYCGPASLKIACERFGREYDEGYLAAVSGAHRLLGTDHDGLVAAVETLGGQCLAAENGTLDEVRRLIAGGAPVIVGWYSPSTPRKTRFDPDKDDVEDHFSVVYHVTDRHVYLMDPEHERGRRRISRRRFERLWWDTDGPDDRRVERWYMAVRFDGLGFDD